MLLAWLDIVVLLCMLGGFWAEAGRLNHCGASAAFDHFFWVFILGASFWVIIVGRALVLWGVLLFGRFGFWLTWLLCWFLLGFLLFFRFFRTAVLQTVANIAVFLPDIFGYHEWPMLLYNNSITDCHNRLIGILMDIGQCNSDMEGHSVFQQDLVHLING